MEHCECFTYSNSFFELSTRVYIQKNNIEKKVPSNRQLLLRKDESQHTLRQL